MTAVHVPVNKQRVHVPLTKQARFTVDRGMVRRQYNRVKLNEMSSLWPFSFMREAAFRAAKQFVSDMQKKDLDLITAEADIRVLGPYVHRRWNGAEFVLGRMAGEDKFEDLADFVLEAEFLNHRLHLIEHWVNDADSQS